MLINFCADLTFVTTPPLNVGSARAENMSVLFTIVSVIQMEILKKFFLQYMEILKKFFL